MEVNIFLTSSTYILVPMFKTLLDGRHQRFKQLCFFELAKKPQRATPYELVWMHEVLHTVVIRQREGRKKKLEK